VTVSCQQCADDSLRDVVHRLSDRLQVLAGSPADGQDWDVDALLADIPAQKDKVTDLAVRVLVYKALAKAGATRSSW